MDNGVNALEPIIFDSVLGFLTSEHSNGALGRGVYMFGVVAIRNNSDVNILDEIVYFQPHIPHTGR